MLEPVRRFIRLLEGAATVPQELARGGFTQESFEALKDKVLTAYRTPPRIAVLGETGVGKSSTVNALFNAGQEVSHTRACTQFESEITVKGGALRIVDMPGLGEDVERDKAHVDAYRRVLPQCDVALWVVKADARAMSNVQRSLRELIDAGALEPRRLVVGINQVDLVQPGSWQREYNMPDREQEATIAARAADVREKLARVVEVPEDRVVWYSATRAYRLPELLHGMEQACDRSRVWLIQDRADFINFEELAEVRDER